MKIQKRLLNYKIVMALSFCTALILVNMNPASAYGGMCSNSGENYTQMKKCMTDFQNVQKMNMASDLILSHNNIASQQMMKKYQVLDNATALALWSESKAKLASIYTKSDVISRDWYNQHVAQQTQSILQFLKEYKATNQYRDFAYPK
jgi:hypothetical protein